MEHQVVMLLQEMGFLPRRSAVTLRREILPSSMLRHQLTVERYPCSLNLGVSARLCSLLMVVKCRTPCCVNVLSFHSMIVQPLVAAVTLPHMPLSFLGCPITISMRRLSPMKRRSFTMRKSVRVAVPSRGMEGILWPMESGSCQETVFSVSEGVMCLMPRELQRAAIHHDSTMTG